MESCSRSGDRKTGFCRANREFEHSGCSVCSFRWALARTVLARLTWRAIPRSSWVLIRCRSSGASLRLASSCPRVYIPRPGQSCMAQKRTATSTEFSRIRLGPWARGQRVTFPGAGAAPNQEDSDTLAQGAVSAVQT